jgi:synaptobrevin family protein YKT6
VGRPRFDYGSGVGGILCGELSLTSVGYLDFVFHVYASSQQRGLTGVIISDDEYPSLAAHQILSKVLDEFSTQHPNAATSNGPISFPPLRNYIAQYQDPQNVGSILKIQKELDETKVVLHKTIESVRLTFLK